MLDQDLMDWLAHPTTRAVLNSFRLRAEATAERFLQLQEVSPQEQGRAAAWREVAKLLEAKPADLRTLIETTKPRRNTGA